MISRLILLSILALPLLAAGVEPVEFDLSTSELGDEPEGGFVIEGDIQVVEVDEGRGVEFGIEPLIESGVLIGDSARGGIVISAKAKSEKAGRSYPRFGVGAHGISGYRVRVVPSRKWVELVAKEEVVSTTPYQWESGTWTRLELRVLPPAEEGGEWTIEARVWADGAERPEEATLSAVDDTLKGQGKASLWATPYAGTPITFADIALGVETAK